LICGQNCGGKSKAGRDLSKLKKWDPVLVEEWDKRRTAYWEDRRRQYENERDEENRQFWERYNRHMKSEKWQAIRRRVFARCKGICEGCAERRAVHVHHLSYEHLGDELLYELVGVCLSCHEKDHGRPLGPPPQVSPRRLVAT
jgi:5-methylcytosine-specific restriction endonuclease McrA